MLEKLRFVALRLNAKFKLHLTICQTSNTFPSVCRATLETAICNLETVAVVQTFDFHGNMQDTGGDPISAEVITDKGSSIEGDITGELSSTISNNDTDTKPQILTMARMRSDSHLSVLEHIV